MASIEEKVEEQYKNLLDSLGIRHYGKTEKINPNITNALRNADSKSGGSGNNYPDIQLIVNNAIGRYVPVMIMIMNLQMKTLKLSLSLSLVSGITKNEIVKMLLRFAKSSK